MKFTYVMDIKCKPEKVWYWLGTPERAKVWQTNVAKTEILEKKPNWVGTTFRETIEENGRSVEMKGEVTAYIENQSLAMHMSGKYNVVDIEWHIRDLGEYTRLTLNSNIRFKSFLKFVSLILWPAFKRNIRGQLGKEYTKLKVLCEEEK
ncbi:MAG: SRPBCC family protein [Dehalococcoidales bacterium]|nr:SRPBCC family protein [Dehalococcoidales bacterium]